MYSFTCRDVGTITVGLPASEGSATQTAFLKRRPKASSLSIYRYVCICMYVCMYVSLSLSLSLSPSLSICIYVYAYK